MVSPSKRLSPAWKNPREIIRKGVRKSRQQLPFAVSSSSPQLINKKNQLNDDNVEEVNSTNTFMRSASITKNPIQKTSLKRPLKSGPIPADGTETTEEELVSDSNALQEFPSSIFDRMKDASVTSQSNDRSMVMEPMPVDFSSIDEFSCSTPVKKIQKMKMSKTKVDSLPIDFRLGLKLRLESSKEFFWLKKSKESDLSFPKVVVTSDASAGGKSSGDHCFVISFSRKGDERIIVHALPQFPSLLISFVRDGDKDDYDDAIRSFCFPSNGIKNANVLESDGRLADASRFLACTLYWHFPDLAWQQSFPRLESESRLIAARNAPVPSLHTLGDPLVEALTRQWRLALDQLYSSWRFGTRPYFYICCHTFTILFLKTVKNGDVEMNDNSVLCEEDCDFRVIITPTTYGFRQKLRDAGIKYFTPCRRNSRRSSSLRSSLALNDSNVMDVTQSQPPLIGYKKQTWSRMSSDSFTSRNLVDFFLEDDGKENETKNENEEMREENWDEADQRLNRSNSSSESDNDEWLRGMGISPRKTLKIKRNVSLLSTHSLDYENSLSLDPDGSFVADENKKSAVVLKDLDSIAMFYKQITSTNFGRPITGPQAGFPPTLLARQPFLHSALKTLECHYREIIKDGASCYVCELENGPIMPHMLIMLESFFRSRTKCNEETASIEAQITGRIKCAGMNEAIGVGGVANFNNFEFRLGSFFKS